MQLLPMHFAHSLTHSLTSHTHTHTPHPHPHPHSSDFQAGESPLGQLPMLDIVDKGSSMRVSQTTAIVNAIARKAGEALEGKPGQQYIVSQMLIAEAEDLYMAMQKHVGTIYRPQSTKGGQHVFDEMWSTVIPPHLVRLEVHDVILSF